MRPLRIVVGEVRQEGSLDLLIALNSGLSTQPRRVTRAVAPRDPQEREDVPLPTRFLVAPPI